ncbi:DsrE family protein [Desulfotomaculum sp. 1211_IL3151]|uniref:DsrE family protein n=1 Tax=Desulfotomaculum sp. 1211_IL3151 TaxID=3084055 RepID=UPI002FD98CFF
MADHKVLFHVSDNEIWPGVLANITNFLKDVGPQEAEVEVVVNSAAVNTFYQTEEKKEILARMAELNDVGVVFKACRNSLRSFDLDEGQRPNFVEVIPAGITELVKKQADGFGYIRP